MHTTFYLCLHNRVVVPAATVLVDTVEDVDGPLCGTHSVSIGLLVICIQIRIARMPSNPDLVALGVPSENLDTALQYMGESLHGELISILARLAHARTIPGKVLISPAVKCIPLAGIRPQKRRETVVMRRVGHTANSIGP